MSDTLRSHLQATRDEIAALTLVAKWADEVVRFRDEPDSYGFDHSTTALVNALEGLRQQPRGDLKAALAILNNAESDMFDHPVGKVRLVPDYQPGCDPEHCAPGWTPDPVPVVSPRPNQQETP